MIFEIESGLQVFYRIWEPEGRPAAKIVITHGYAEHSGRYEHAGRYLAESGYRVYAFDQPGHGQSGGRKGVVEGIKEYAEILDCFIRHIKKEREEGKIFLIGHSMGGAVAAAYCAIFGNGIDGLVTSAAAVIPVPGLAWLFKSAAEWLSRLAPEVRTVKLPPEKLSRDKNVVKDYLGDQLNYTGRIKLKTAVELSKSEEIIRKTAKYICEPLLVMHGSDDTLAKPEGSLLLYENASSEDKTLKIFEGLRHELFNEPEKKEVLETVKSWISERTGTR